MTKIAILHFAPLELYPPVQNLLRELSKKNTKEVVVFTTYAAQRNLSLVCFDGIEIIRVGTSGKMLPVWKRYLGYLSFYATSFLMMLLKEPLKVLYFETLSSFPAYLYRRFINSSCPIFIHYHEYTSPEEYKSGMFLLRYFHQRELWLYPKANWISHTNNYRMEMFKKDIFPVEIKNAFVLPNYPPQSWQYFSKKEQGGVLKIVNVGALGWDTMYVKEFAQWVMAQQGRVLWDVYSNNYDIKAQEYISSVASQWINLKQGVNYDDIPQLIVQYDVGVVLYNGCIPNHIFAVSNKLFEYLACGLDVWFPHVMIGSLQYQDIEHYPKVAALDFTKLSEISLDELLYRPTQQKTDCYWCERALEPLIFRLNAG